MIGVDSGAMIIAPITVAVESDRTPAVAITADSVSIVQNEIFDAESPEVRSRSSASSANVRRGDSGSTRTLRPAIMTRVSRPVSPTAGMTRKHGIVCGSMPLLSGRTADESQSRGGGAKGTRTPNPLLAKQVRYQLRHGPGWWARGAPG